jgi:hypothetical protein
VAAVRRCTTCPTNCPPDIADDVAEWPKYRMGVNRVRVELTDGRTFDNVMVAGARCESPGPERDSISMRLL